MTPQPRRKKWTEAEERTLIDKYGEMSNAGTLAKMKTREKKYKPIALYVNSMHHMRDPVSYPWQWTWKDVSTKVQNMRHQYALVKQNIKKQESSIGRSCDEFDWMEGITHWSNFLKYKEVFGDVQLVFNGNNSMMVVGGENDCDGGFELGSHEMDIMQFEQLGQVADGDFMAGIDGVENGVMDLGFDYDGDEGDENYNGVNNKSESSLREEFVCEDIEPSAEMRKKRKMLKGAEKKALSFLSNQLSQLKEMEAQFELRDVERENKRQRREHLQIETERERKRKLEDVENDKEGRSNPSAMLRRQWIQEFEVLEQESEERERRRREEEMLYEREWEDRLNKRRSEWKKRMDEKLSQHRAEMSQIQARILHEQQNVTTQFIGLVSLWTGPPAGLSDHTGASSHYLSQMIQNLPHVNSMVHGDARVEGDDNQEDQFIVDG